MTEEQEQETPAVTEVAVMEVAVTTPAETAAAAVSAEELGKVRALVLQAHPDVVGDLVKGSSIDELLASVEPARTAYQQVAEKVRGGNPTTTAPETVMHTGVVTPPVVPAGGTAAVVDPAVLGPTTKIAQALAARRKK